MEGELSSTKKMQELESQHKEVNLDDVIEDTAKVTDSWMRLVSVVGVPSVIALYLVYSFTSSMEADIKQLNTAMPMHVQATQKLNETNDRMLDVLRSICVNSAKDNQERSNCFGAK